MRADELTLRLANLQREVRRLRVVVGLCVLGVAVLALSASTQQEGQEVVRARTLIIVDDEGRERIVMGAPVPEPEGMRVAPVTGLVINDEAGAERFGVGLLQTGAVVLGLDAPPGTGDGGNRERITLSAGATGGAELRFLNRKSVVAAHMSLFRDDEVRLFFTSHREDGNVVHRISAEGDTVVVHPG